MQETAPITDSVSREATQDQVHFEKTIAVAVGQVAGFCFSFFIPVFLSRWLTVGSYGTYKQVILIQWFFLMTLQMGLDSGIFYFTKREPAKAAIFSLNAVWVEFLWAAVVAGFLYLFRFPLANLFHDPDLAPVVPALCVLILFSIPAQHLEHYLMLLDKIRYQVTAFSLSELLKAVAVIGGYAYFHSLRVVVFGLAGIALARLTFLVGWNLRRLRRDRIALPQLLVYLPRQLRYGLPLGFSQLVAIFCKMDRFVIAMFFSVQQFALYSVGAFEVPLIPGITNTMSDLMSFDMVEASVRHDYARIKFLWRATKRKIALLQIPVAVYLFFFAKPVVTFIFSQRYAESAAYFRVFMLIFLLSTFDGDIVFRTFADNRRFLKAQLAASLAGLGVTIAGALTWGPMGALLGKFFTEGVALVAKLTLAKRLLRVKTRELLPWPELLKITGAAVMAALSAQWLVREIPLPGAPIFRIAFSLIMYGAGFAYLALALDIVKSDEKKYLRRKFTKA